MRRSLGAATQGRGAMDAPSPETPSGGIDGKILGVDASPTRFPIGEVTPASLSAGFAVNAAAVT